MAEDMWDGAEAYLQMWERAHGIPARGCRPAHGALTTRGRGRLGLGDDWETLLRRAGQPQQRSRAWSWCVRGRGNRRAADVAVLSDSGRVELVGSTARGRSAAGIRVGAPASGLRGARSLGRGVRVRPAGRVAWVYAVRGGRVRAVAVASRSLARNPAALRAAIDGVRSADAKRATPEYLPSPAEEEAAGRLAGRSLAGSGNSRMNAALALLCSVQGSPPGAR